MEEMTIGDFSRQSHLSPKALRLYDDLGLLVPARVDVASGYRFYNEGQLAQARLVSALRQLRMPLAEIKAVLASDTHEAAKRVLHYWTAAEADHVSRRQLAHHLIDRLQGKRSDMYEVTTTELPSRSLLCLKRSVTGVAGAWALGKEFIGLLGANPLPPVGGRAGATFCIYWSEISEDSEGPLEWCRPVPPEQAEALAASVPELRLRQEPAHDEALVHLGPYGQTGSAQWELVTESLRAWTSEHGVRPSELGVRLIYRFEGRVGEDNGPDCDFAVPFTR
jgi:DNA-binding transcriptional MerR regulator